MDFWSIQVPIPVALGLVALIGYVFGRRTRTESREVTLRSRRELRRAQQVASELDKIAYTIRQSLAAHNASVSRFKQRLGELNDEQVETAFKTLCREAEEILKPTTRLAAQISAAYDEIRQQSANLMTFTEVRTDPLTGVHNRRGFDDALAAQFALLSRYGAHFSVALFDIDHFKAINDAQGHLFGDRQLQALAKLLDEEARETDVVARYGGEEFVVIMPQTDLPGGCIFAERFRAAIERKLRLTVSGGVAEALDGDSSESLLARADAALYAAKDAGRNQIFLHDGHACEALTLPASPVEL